MAITNQRIAKLCEEFGLDELTAWRHLRDQEILRRRYQYQLPARYRNEGN